MRVRFDARLRLEFQGAKVTSDAGPLAVRELDAALGLSQLAERMLRETRTGRNIQHELVPLLRQSVYSRLAGYEDLSASGGYQLFCFNQYGDCEGAMLRPGHVHSAHDWKELLEPVVARYRDSGLRKYLRADAAFASPEGPVGSGAVRIRANLVVSTPLAVGTQAKNRETVTPRKEKRVDGESQVKLLGLE